MSGLRAPFPYWGGKSAIAPLVWQRIGDVENFVEPFFGSGAVLLARSDAHRWWERTETANDADGLVSNFWRAVQHDPASVAHWADRPVNENDLHAIHAWLVREVSTLGARLEGNPDYYDAKIAGWWVWGMCAWIGSGWCSGAGPWHVVDGLLVNTRTDGAGTWRQLPHLGNDGSGINRQRPHLGNDGRGQCAAWTAHLIALMERLADRLRRVRVCSGDWTRVLGETPTIKLGTTGVFLDPPYARTERDGALYRTEMESADAVRDWAVAHGDDPRYRIALCGYVGERTMPDGWDAVPWKARGGYGSQGDGRGRANAAREVAWFSPHCLKPVVRQAAFAWDEEEPV